MSVHRVYPDNYFAQLEQKAALTRETFAPLRAPELEVFPSPSSHFRMRAEFKVWHTDGKAYYAMYQPGQRKKPFIIDSFPVACEQINLLMPPILSAINADDSLRRKLFQIEFLTSTSGDTVVTLIYHKPLTDDWCAAAQALGSQLKINIIGRSRKQKIVLGRDYVEEAFRVDGTTYSYRQVEGAFSQPNAAICQEMLNWASKVSQGLGGDLLELYCGNGNFTLPLARQFGRVLATEISKSSVATAQINLAANGVENVQIARMSSEEFTQAIEGVREFRRLRHIDLAAYHFTTAFVDPPRAGLDSATLELVRRHDNIIYISCNPATLYRDAAALASTHEIKRFALFDQFPYTDHRECGLLIQRR